MAIAAAAIANRSRLPTYHGPASIGALTMLAGLALVYWALTGFGIVKGATPQERYKATVERIKTP
jgi:hypothetical protein